MAWALGCFPGMLLAFVAGMGLTAWLGLTGKADRLLDILTLYLLTFVLLAFVFGAVNAPPESALLFLLMAIVYEGLALGFFGLRIWSTLSKDRSATSDPGGTA